MNRFALIAEKRPDHAAALAAAFASAHSSWEEVYAGLRAIRALTGTDAFGYLGGCHLTEELLGDDAEPEALREEAQAWREGLA